MRVPVKIQGRKRPQRVRVFSTITPMIGSLKASKTRAAIIVMPMKAPEAPRTSL